MKKQTAVVDWLEKQIRWEISNSEKLIPIFEQAKEMFEQQVKDAFERGDANAVHRIVQERENTIQYAEQYYKETYEK